MKVLAILFLAVSVVSAAVSDATEAEQRERLLQALAELGAAPMTQESEYLRELVMRESVDIAARVDTFDAFFTSHPFTEYHASNLEAHIVHGTSDPERMARFAGAFSAAALRFYWENVAEGVAAPASALFFLEQIYTANQETIVASVANGIDDALQGRPVPVAQHLRADSLSPPEAVADAMQCCITLGVFKGERVIDRWLILPTNTARFVNAAEGVWLFDGDVLSEAHKNSLESLFKAIPPALHGVAALFVPDAIQISAASAPLRLPGMALDMPLMQLDIMRDMSEQPPYVPQPPVPEFTLMALEQVMRAVIATRLPTRGDLAQRAAVVMRLAAAMPDAPTAQLTPPNILLSGAPDAFLAYLGVLWLVNAEAVLEAAIMLAEEGAREPLYALFLVADLCSMDGDATLLFRTTPNGTLTASETALRRMYLTPTVSYVNGIALGGRIWQYDMTAIAFLP